MQKIALAGDSHKFEDSIKLVEKKSNFYTINRESLWNVLWNARLIYYSL